MFVESMTLIDVGIVAAGFLAVALLYSMVGQGGGSGYLAVMAMAGFVPSVFRPMALSLNILVTSITLIRFVGAGGFRWNLFWPFAAASIPAAFIAGWLLELDPTWYRLTVGVILLFSASRLVMHLPSGATGTSAAEEKVRALRLPVALGCGTGIGLISGLIGVGGGIFLAPLVLLTRWATAKQTAGLCAAFILVNSIAGLSGIIITIIASGERLPVEPSSAAVWAASVIAGGSIGSGIGSRHLGHVALRRVLGAALIFAGLRMLLSTWLG